MTKRAAGWIGALGLLLVAALCAAVLARGVLVRGLRREFHRPILVTARAAPDTSQTAAPRAPDFLQPQRLDAWRIIGPGGCGTFYYPAISPHDSNLVFATTDMTACYVSENGGRTWRTFNLRHSCNFVFDPKLPNRVFAIAAGLWRSDDRGHTWSLTYPDAKTRVEYLDDEADPYVFSSMGYTRNLSAMAVDPDDSNTLYASASDQLEVSHDAGKSWKLLAADLDAQQALGGPHIAARQAHSLHTPFQRDWHMGRRQIHEAACRGYGGSLPGGVRDPLGRRQAGDLYRGPLRGQGGPAIPRLLRISSAPIHDVSVRREVGPAT